MPKAALLRQFIKKSKGFDKVLSKLEFLTASNGNCTATIKLDETHLNPMGTLHGGFSSTLVDVVSSLGLYTHERGVKPSVSVNINMTYMKSAVPGDDLLIESKAIKVGNNVAFLNVDIKNKKTGDLLVQGTHTKYILTSRPSMIPT